MTAPTSQGAGAPVDLSRLRSMLENLGGAGVPAGGTAHRHSQPGVLKTILKQVITTVETKTRDQQLPSTHRPPSASQQSQLSLRPPSQVRNPEVLLLELRKLMSEFSVAMTEVGDLSIEKLIGAKNERAQFFIKKTIELAKKFVEAMGSWLNKLPSFLTGVATMVVLAALTCVAVAAMPASGGLSGALVMALVLAMAATYTGVQTCGQFANDVKNPDDPKPFGFAGMEKNGELPKGVGTFLDACLSGDPAGAIAGLAIIGGTRDEEKLMILSATLTALSMVISVGCLLKCSAGSAAVKLAKVARFGQMAAAGASTTSGVTGIASAGTQYSENRNQVAASSAQAKQIEARFAMEQVLRVLLDSLKAPASLLATDQSVSEKVVKALESTFRTASNLVSPTA